MFMDDHSDQTAQKTARWHNYLDHDLRANSARLTATQNTADYNSITAVINKGPVYAPCQKPNNLIPQKCEPTS